MQTASVLFVDNPVGTGFSYVDGPDGFSRDVATVASDMLVLLRSFFTQRSELQVQLPRPSLPPGSQRLLPAPTRSWPLTESFGPLILVFYKKNANKVLFGPSL